MSEAKHTPLPWIWDEPDNWLGLSARICTEKYEPIAQVQLSGWPRRVGLANAAFLVRAANAHDALVAACEQVLRTLEEFGYGGSTRTANQFENRDTKALRAVLALAKT